MILEFKADFLEISYLTKLGKTVLALTLMKTKR